MKAMIFAAGLGSRLKPLTDDKPKALVEVGGQTLLERSIKKLISEGFEDIIINIHHLGEMIVDYLRENNSFGANSILISDERDGLLDTGGGLKHARRFFNTEEDFLIYNVDIISDINLRELYKYHRESRALATLAVRDRNSNRKLLFNEDGLLRGWINLDTKETKPHDIAVNGLLEFAYSGIQMVNREVFSMMPSDDKFSIIDYYLQICVEKKVAFFDHSEDIWFDLGSCDKIKSYLSGFYN